MVMILYFHHLKNLELVNMDQVISQLMYFARHYDHNDSIVWSRHAIEEYVAEARNIFNDILEALADALSLERHVFLQNFDPNETEINVRVNYYPPCPRPDQALGLTPHTDASALTLLLQFKAGGGLQVFKDMKWVTVPWPKEALLVNVGDLLEIMSNGMFRSPWHRVVTQMDVERFSVALFYNPSPRIQIEPIGDCSLSDDNEGYKNVVVGDYLRHFYRISPTVEKQAINFAKRVPKTLCGCGNGGN